MCWMLAAASIPILTAAVYLIESQSLHLVPMIAAQIRSYAQHSSFAMIDLFRPVCVLTLFAAAMLVRAWVFRREAYRVRAEACMGAWAFAIIWTATEFIGVLLQRRMYAYHFLPLAVPAALLFGAIARRTTTAQLAGVLALPVVLSLWGAVEVARTAARIPSATPVVASWLDAHSLPGERVWRDITPSVLIPTDLRAASRVQLSFLFMNDDDAPRRFSRMLLDDWRVHRPRYIVLPSDIDRHVRTQTKLVFELSRLPRRAEAFGDAWKEIERFVRQRYIPAHTVGDETIFQRDDTLLRQEPTR
jgi:hypothetical protein